MMGMGMGVGFSSSPSPWTPAAVSGCVGLWESDAVTLNAGAASAVTDKSGAGHPWLQAVGASQPAFVVSGSSGFLRFNEKFLKTAPFTLNQPWSLFLAAAWTNVPGATRYLCDGNTGASCAIINNDGAFPGVAKAFAGSYGPGQAFTAGTWYIWEVIFAGAASKFALSGGAYATGNSNTGNAGGITIGGSAEGGALALTDVYGGTAFDHAVTADERALTLAYLRAQAAKAGVVIA